VGVGVGAVVVVGSCLEVDSKAGVTVGGIVHSADVTLTVSDDVFVSAAVSPQAVNAIAVVHKRTPNSNFCFFISLPPYPGVRYIKSPKELSLPCFIEFVKLSYYMIS
jgi:hypothetical protein